MSTKVTYPEREIDARPRSRCRILFSRENCVIASHAPAAVQNVQIDRLKSYYRGK